MMVSISLPVSLQVLKGHSFLIVLPALHALAFHQIVARRRFLGKITSARTARAMHFSVGLQSCATCLDDLTQPQAQITRTPRSSWRRIEFIVRKEGREFVFVRFLPADVTRPQFHLTSQPRCQAVLCIVQGGAVGHGTWLGR